MESAPAVTLPASALESFPRFSLYNSPYPAHDAGCAVDLYPGEGAAPGGSDPAPSPVAGEVLDVRSVRAPPKPYAESEDHLILVDVGEHVARVLHVDPAVEPGDRVAVGDRLGTLVRAGFFAPWVANHVHLGFRRHDQHLTRATGSLPLAVEAPVEAVPWDGTGRVAAVGETFVVLDEPGHPAPGERYAGLAARVAPDAADTAPRVEGEGGVDRPRGGDAVVIDGGLVHYRGGGALPAEVGTPASRVGTPAVPSAEQRALWFLGERVGTVRGRTVEWADLAIRANGRRITGLSLFAARDALGAKLVCPGHDFAVGDRVAVDLAPADDPTVLSGG